jgi:phytoene synthase
MRESELRPTDLARCVALLRAGSKSFDAVARLLPGRVRDSATVLYAFCREADDLIDGGTVPSFAAVAALRARLAAIYAGAPDDDPVDRALAVVVRRERLPIELLHALLEGFQWDAEGRRYETLEDLEAYAARVAGAVGALMTLIMGERAPETVARACELGVAMQLTNIARDVGEDARRGRIYLPLAWLRDADVDPQQWLTAPAASDPLRFVVSRLLEASSRLYASADLGVAFLPGNCRVAIRAAGLIYADIGRSIARSGFDSVSGRAVVPRSRKLWLMARAIVARFRRAPRVSVPPLPSVRFLVAAAAEPR